MKSGNFDSNIKSNMVNTNSNFVDKFIDKKLGKELPYTANLEQFKITQNGIIAYVKLNTKLSEVASKEEKQKVKEAIESKLGKEFKVSFIECRDDKVKAYCSTSIKKQYRPLKSSKAVKISANVFKTDEDKIWNVEEINGEKYLVRDINDDLNELLNMRKNFTTMTASVIDELQSQVMEAKIGSVVVFYDDNANTMKSGVVLTMSDDSNEMIVNDGSIDYHICKELIASVDSNGIVDRLKLDLANLQTNISMMDFKDKALTFYNILYRDNIEAQNMIKQIVENMAV